MNMASTSGSSQLLVMNKSFRRYRKRLLCISAAVVSSSLVACSLTIGLFLYFHTDDSPHLRSNLFARIRITKVEDEQIEWSSILKNPENDQTKHTKEMVEYQLKVALMQVADEVESVSVMKFQEDQFARLVGASNRGVEVSFKIELSQMINSSKEVEDFKDKLVMFFAKDNKMVVDLDSLEITSDPKLQGRSFDTFETFLSDSRYDLSHVELSGITRPEINDDKITCPTLQTIDYGFISPLTCLVANNSKLGDTCFFFCVVNHTLIGEDKITCMSTGHWSHSPPLCKVQCQPLGKAFGIEVQPRSCSDKVSLASTHCFHHCASGFVLDGDASRICTGAGAWSGTPPVCRRTCASLSIPDNGNIWPTSCSTDHIQPAGTVCSFSCREGYALAGSPTLLCDMDGRWNFPAPTCRQGCFPLLAPASGEIFPSICAENSVTAGRRAVVMEGIICVAWCSEGYRLEGSAQRLCTTGGIWTGEETYCSKLCPSLKLPRLMGASPAYCTDVKRKSELAEGQKCELFCPDGFEPSNEVDAVMCLSNGSWSQIPDACIRTCRSHAKVLNGVLSPDSCYGANPLLQDTRCTLDCDDGFELRGAMQVQCLATGKWTDHLGECLKRCPSLTPPSHGSLTPNNCSADQLFQGSECEYICDSDYGLEGDESRTCLTDGTWSGDPPECVAENQFLIRQTTADRDVCLDVNTVTGFVEKKQIKKCSFNNRLQRWTILSQGLIRNVALRKCIEVVHTEAGSYLTLQDCSDDDERQKWDWTDNGDVTLHNTNLQLGYGYASIGKIMLVEESDALTWYAVTSSGQQSLYSTFSNSSCPRLRVPSFTNISPTACAENQTIANETTCSFSCAENRKLVGEGNRSCSNGRWNGTYPTCETACQPLSSPSGNGTVTAECQSGLQDEGKVCEFDCPLSNYHLEGEAVLICLSTGNWSTSPATCTLRCPQLDAVENGILFPSSCSADDSSIGASCNLSCEQPYKAKTLTSLTCLTNGSWSFGNFSCEQGCYDVNAPPGGGNVSCDSDELWEGDQCAYSCGDEEHRVLVSVTPGSGDTTLLADPGPSGTISRTCRANGTFNGTLPSCVSVCEQLSIPSNGTLQPSNCSSSRKVEGSRCELRCSMGFGVQGSPVATCQSDGEWSMDGFQCQEETQFVIKIKDSSNPVCLEVNTSLAENHLDYLRVLKRDSISTCLNSTNALWTWSSAHQLKHVQSRYCLAVLDKNAKRLTPLLLRNCSTSDLSQQWSCSPTDPHLLHLTHHPLHVHLGDSNSNQAAAYRHPVGHIINEKELWLGVDATNNSHAVAPCSLHTDRCAPFVIPEHATVTPSSCSDGNVVSVNTTCIVTCSTGYILRHILTTGISATCNDQTEWDYNDTINTFPLECTQPCPGMSVESSVNFSSNCENGLATFGDVCNFTCDGPNQMIGEPRSICGLNGAWSSTSPTCIPVCPHLAPSTHTLANQTVYATPGNCLYDDDILASQVGSGDECSYSCNPMYTAGNTSMTRTCLTNGSFDHSLPTCYIPQASTTYSDSSCGTPPSHSQYVGRLLRVENCTTPADTQRLCAVYGCSSGYKIPSGDTIHCVANSYTWPSPPLCKRSCPDISTQCSGKVEGEYCIIECEAQQTISHGNNRLLCNVDGTWSDTLPYCVDKAHFKIQSSLQSSGDSLCISHNGKVNVDAKVMLASCSPSNQNDLLWSWESSSLIRHIRSGFCLSSSDRKHGSSLKLEECNVLDQLQQWRCSDVADHPHRINLRSDDEFMWVAGSVLTGNSSDGVRLLHSSFFTDSQKNSSELGVSWVAMNESQPSVTNVTLCAVQSSVVQCPPLSSVVPLGGVMEPSMCAETWSQEGQNCTLECGSGYTLPSDSSPTSECLREGTWSTLEFECLQVCPNLASPEHGAISACNESSITEGSTCDFTCDEDYELIGDSQRVCQWDGRWSGITVLCAKRCETLPVPSNALVSPQECASEDSDVISGTVCLYTCVEGYRISIALDASSEVTRTCFQNGTWSDRAPSCVRVCSAQEDPPNGKISPVLCTTQSSTAGFSCKVKCDDGYAVFGNDTRECGSDGVWTNSVTDDLGAVCRSKCHPLPATDNSVMECNVIGSSSSEFVSGSRCSVECESGFGLAAGSSRTRQCNDSATWTGQAMTCEREEQFAVFLRRTSKSNLKPHICLVADGDDLDAVNKKDYSQCQTEQNLLHKWSWYNNWLIKNAGTGRCLSVENLEVGEKLRTTACDDVTNNKWSCDAVSGRPWFLRLAASNFFLDYGHASSTNVWLMNTESIDLKHDEVHWYARHFNPDGYTPLTQSPPVTVCSMRLNHGICSPLRSPAYGSVHPYACSGNEMGIHVGTKCQFECVVGYKLTGGSTQATCQQNGLWSGATPLCTALCPRLPAPAHGRIFPPSCVENVDSDDEDSSHHTGVIQDGTCSFECNRGWRLVDGPSILSCLRSRKWNARQPTCKRVCPVLSSAENAEVLNQDCLTTELTEGSICTYQCHDGYAIRSVSALCNTQSNSSVMTAAMDNGGYCSNEQSENDDGYETVVHLSCSSDGKWSASEPDCGPLCPPLSYPKNGFVRPLSCVERPQVAGTSCAFECNEKYFARGEWSNVTCHSGKWIPTQRLLDSDFDVYGLDDYELLIPTCDFYCPPLVMVAANRSTLLPSKCTSEKNKVGSKCEIVCESGFILRGTPSVTCRHDGTWDGSLGFCLKKCPSLGAPPNGAIHPIECTMTQMGDGATCTFSCMDKYALDGAVTTLCNGSGLWSSPTPTCKRRCSALPQLYNGQASPITSCFTEHITMGEQCSFSCLDGFLLVGSDTVECTESGEWNNEPPTCNRICANPGVNHGHVMCVIHGAEQRLVDDHVLTWGTKCRVECAVNYSPTRGTVFTCMNDGQWRPSVPDCVETGVAMYILQTLGSTSVCLTEDETKHVVVQMSQSKCLEHGDFVNPSTWRWLDQYNIQNAHSGNCIAVRSASENERIRTVPCNTGHPLQHWDCSVHNPFQVVLHGTILAPTTFYSSIGEVILQTWSDSHSYYSTFDLVTLTHSSICSRRPGSVCPPLSNPEGGRVVPVGNCTSDNVRAGQYCSYECNEGISLHGDDFTTCMGNGLWMNPPPICTNLCEPLAGDIAPSSYLIDADCVFDYLKVGHLCAAKCVSGYDLHGNDTRECLPSGLWSPLQYQCHRTCSSIFGILNGEVSPLPCRSNLCEFKCKPGYVLVGENRELRCVDGSWDNVLPKCIQDIQFRIILKGSSTQREMCLTVDKDPDKPLVKAPCTPLQSNDGSQLFKWGFTSDQLIHPDSGKCINGSRQTWGKIRLSNCSDADPDQLWDCGESSGSYEYSLRLRNSSSFLDNGPSADYLPTPLEGLLHVVMETDYYETSHWLARHHFGKGTVCSMRSTKQCPPFPQILNGVVSPSSCHDHSAVVKGLVCSVTCDAGYMLDLTEQAVCGSDGTWSTPIPVCTGIYQCPGVTLLDPSVKVEPSICSSKAVSEGYSCKFFCEHDHYMVGNRMITCKDEGTWAGFPPSCKPLCGALSYVQGATISPMTCYGPNNLLGTVCTLTCDTGLNLVGVASRTCRSDGSWSGSEAQCVAYCPAVLPPTSGNVYPDRCKKEKNYEENACNFRCNLGFLLIGPDRITCTNGKWAGEIPECAPLSLCTEIDKDKAALEDIIYSKLIDGRAIGDATEIRLTCKDGYKLNGPSTRRCMSNGQWLFGLPKCTATCPPLQPPNHGSIVPSSCSLESQEPEGSCMVRCEEGWTLDGDAMVHCGADGKWTPSTPRCVGGSLQEIAQNPFIVHQKYLDRGVHVCLQANNNSSLVRLSRDCDFTMPMQSDLQWKWRDLDKGLVESLGFPGSCWAPVRQKTLVVLGLSPCDLNDPTQSFHCGDVSLRQYSLHVGTGVLWLALDEDPYDGLLHLVAAPQRHLLDWEALAIDANQLNRDNMTPSNTMCRQMCGGYLRSSSGSLYSPGYPSNYPRNTICQWEIEMPGYVLRLWISDIDVTEGKDGSTTHCDRDYVIVAEGGGFEVESSHILLTICGQSRESVGPITSRHGRLMLKFKSDDVISKKRGFNARWMAEELPKPLEDCASPLPEATPRGNSPHFARLVGGEQESTERVPWHASLYRVGFGDDTAPICGAAIIRDRYLLTAAHCVDDVTTEEGVKSLVVAFGSSESWMLLKLVTKLHNDDKDALDDVAGAVASRVSRLFVHPGYNAKMENDIALLQVSSTISWTSDVFPVCLPPADVTSSGFSGRVELPKLYCKMAGWSEDGGLASIQLPTMSDRYCVTMSARMFGHRLNPNTTLCAGHFDGTRQAPCDGDSGGGLVCEWNDNLYLVGVASQQIAACTALNSPRYFARTSTQRSWIDERIRKAGAGMTSEFGNWV